MIRNELFEKMVNLSEFDEHGFLCRLFGLMECCEAEKKAMKPEDFFSMIEKWTERG
jgi:hypothetical protein